MSYESELAKEAGYQIEMVKDSLKQVQSGAIKVTFTIHPNDMPPELYTDVMGQRYVCVLVPIGDNEEPRMKGDPLVETPSGGSEAADSSRHWNDLKYSEKAGIMCADTKFHEFLSYDFQDVWIESANKYNKEDVGDKKQRLVAGQTIRHLCGVQTRADIVPDSEAARIFDDICGQFRMWKQYG